MRGRFVSACLIATFLLCVRQDSTNKSASLEFSVPQRDADAFFPIQVHFASKQLNAGVDVASVLGENGPISFGVQRNVVSEAYKVE